MRTDSLAHRLSVVIGRLRERALAAGTFDLELAADLEVLAEVAATLQTISNRVDQFVDDMVEWVHE